MKNDMTPQGGFFFDSHCRVTAQALYNHRGRKC